MCAGTRITKMNRQDRLHSCKVYLLFCVELVLVFREESSDESGTVRGSYEVTCISY